MSDRDLENRLAALEMPPVFSKSITELRKEAEESTEARREPPIDPKREARKSLRYTFDFDFVGKNGKRWEGRFTSVIPTIRTRQMIGALRAQMAGGLPPTALDDDTASINFVIAHLTFMLDEKESGFPAWAKDLRAIEDPDVLYALWNTEVQPHEATFLGRA